MKKINITNKEFMKLALMWGKENGDKYILDTFGECNYYIHSDNDMLEVFIEDEVLENYSVDNDDYYNDTCYMIEGIVEKNNLLEEELTGEELAFFSEDFIGFGQIGIHNLSDLVEDLKTKVKNNRLEVA